MTGAEMLLQAPEMARLATAAQRAFVRRILAAGIDVLVLSLITFFINGVFGVTHVTSGSLSRLPVVASPCSRPLRMWAGAG